MNLNSLIKYICTKEGRKHQASVGDVREILKIIIDLEATFVDSFIDPTLNETPCLLIHSLAVEKHDKRKKKKK